MDELTTIDTTSPENVQRAALLFAASLLLEVANPKHDAFPNRTWDDAVAALERWAVGEIGNRPSPIPDSALNAYNEMAWESLLEAVVDDPERVSGDDLCAVRVDLGPAVSITPTGGPPTGGTLTVWVHGREVEIEVSDGETSEQVARRLAEAINAIDVPVSAISRNRV